ncbi:hypothetical protein QNN88_10090 [Citrobacter sp. ANG330]|uniref:hypothetical protein n=1 Tax=Citrobacter sp. ANG330 TaxID=3048142 RepID=UPI0039C0CBFE
MDLGLLVQQALTTFGADAAATSGLAESPVTTLTFDNCPEINIGIDDDQALIWAAITDENNPRAAEEMPEPLQQHIAEMVSEISTPDGVHLMSREGELQLICTLNNACLESQEELALALGLFYNCMEELHQYYNM